MAMDPDEDDEAKKAREAKEKAKINMPIAADVFTTKGATIHLIEDGKRDLGLFDMQYCFARTAIASRLSIPDNLIVSQYNGVKVHALMEKGRRCHPNLNQLTMAAMESSQPSG